MTPNLKRLFDKRRHGGLAGDLADRDLDALFDKHGEALVEALEPFRKVGEALRDQPYVEWLWVQSHSDPNRNVGIHIQHIRAIQDLLTTLEQEAGQ
jgi:hypothetical protein